MTGRCARWAARHVDDLALAPAALVTVALLLTLERAAAGVDAVRRGRAVVRCAVRWGVDIKEGW